MPRDLEHLQLPVWSGSLPRRKHGGGQSFAVDRGVHGRTLLFQAGELVQEFQTRKRVAPQGINPKLIFKIQLRADSALDDEQIERLDLTLLARNPQKAIVVFPDEETLSKLQTQLQNFAGLVPDGHEYAYLAGIISISPLSPEDRIGKRLRENPLAEEEIAHLDVELWHTGVWAECKQFIDEIDTLLKRANLRVTDWWIGQSLCLIRAQINAAMLAQILDIDYVKEVDRRPQPSFEMRDVVLTRLQDISVDPELPEDTVGVLVIDSGITQQHPLLRHAIGDAQVFPDRLREQIQGGAEDGDATRGHGTAVAGIAAYDDFGKCLESRSFRASARIFSARVTNEVNDYIPEELIEHQLESAVEYFVGNYPSVRVINISLGDRNFYFSDDEYQFRFAAAVDELAYQFKDRNILFVISAGNFDSPLSPEETIEQYPEYLLFDPSARILDPATSALALTVGGLSYGQARDLRGTYDTGIERVVAEERGWPSSFTRVGWGVDGAIKPDVVDFAGDTKFERNHLRSDSPDAGLPTANRFFAREGRLVRTVAGTSFAAPRVANLAARLYKEFPSASSNLIRALISASAEIPTSRPRFFENKDWSDDDILRVYGYGQPDFERARWSSGNNVLLVDDSALEVDSFVLYTVPSLPEEFFNADGRGILSVALAFDPPTRHTRADSYLGVKMEFVLYRNVSPEAVNDALRNWTPEQRQALEEKPLPAKGNLRAQGAPPITIDLKPGVLLRKKGTLQRGIVRISGARWAYDNNPLVLAVICQREWAPPEITHQRFAVVVSVSHEDESVDLYNRISQQARLYQRVRIQV